MTCVREGVKEGDVLSSGTVTTRDRSKSVPYLTLKNSKGISNCQSIGELGNLL